MQRNLVDAGRGGGREYGRERGKNVFPEINCLDKVSSLATLSVP